MSRLDHIKVPYQIKLNSNSLIHGLCLLLLVSQPPVYHNHLKLKLKFAYTFSFLYNVLQDPKTRYPVVVRFNKVNYANVSTNNYALDEIKEVQ